MMMKRLAALILTLCMLLGCTAIACAESADNPLLFTVNGREYFLSDVQPIYDYYIEMYSYYGYDMTSAENQRIIRAFSTQEMVWEAVISVYAAENGLESFTDEELNQLVTDNDALWEEAIANYIYEETGVEEPADIAEDELAILRENAIAYYQAGGYTKESTLENAKANAINQRVKAAVLADEDITVTDEDIEAYHASIAEEDRSLLYDEDGYGMSPAEIYSMYTYFGYELNYIPAGFRSVKHILLDPDEEALNNYLTLAATWEEQAEATETGEGTDENAVTFEQVETARQAVIDSVRETLDAIDAALDEGKSFDELIALYGTDSGMTVEPALSQGYLVSEGSLEYDSTFVQGVFGIEHPGEISDPVVTSFGVHLILYVDDIAEGPTPLTDAMREDYRETLLADKEDEIYSAMVEHWISQAEIVYTDAGQDWNMEILMDEEETTAE
ncbi:MAG: peptidylprolyl isomerase [Clostridia bacterium]|nr:peptidylprolyl isomerase [Clostridia bacterium]